MKLSDFDYFLDTGRIAQEPVPERDHARLMVLDRQTGDRHHRRFFEITDFLRPGDVLVLNDTRVIPARLHARKESGGQIEVFLLRDLGENRWEVMIRGKVAPDTVVLLESGAQGIVEKVLPDGKRVVRFLMKTDLLNYMERFGKVPLPPYIHRNGGQKPVQLDRERYQTVYARDPGAVAAPTAGLHFTEGLLQKIRKKGVRIVTLTLHVGYGTFKPVTVETIEEHKMDEEYYSIDENAARTINGAIRDGSRIIAVGTTSTRALESAVDQSGYLTRHSGSTDLFIYPGYKFRVIQALITNFHLPRSTLLMLVSAFAGKEAVDRAYQEAREMEYRFYSYGDAMFIQ